MDEKEEKPIVLGLNKFKTWELNSNLADQPKSFRLGPITGGYHWSSWSRGAWVRAWGRGVTVTNSALLFSERKGYSKFIKLPFGYRLRISKRKRKDEDNYA